MTDFVHQASDDQVALAICLGAVAFCGLIMYFSHHVGRLTGHIRLHEAPASHLPAVVELPHQQPREKAA
ncbi:MAG: hypothetical protein ACKV0T_30285 [Planctomycetales bacterium]